MKNILWFCMAVCLLPASQAESKYLEQVIRCESTGFAPEQCRFTFAPRNTAIKEVRMIRQYSAKPCIEGKSWEAVYGGLIVTSGCRADFHIVYQLPDDGDRNEDHNRRRYQDHSHGDEDGRRLGQDDPAVIVIRAFAEILDRRPTRQELREYRSLITRHNWSEEQLRRELRRRYSE